VVRRITYDTHLESAVADSDLIIEAVPEDLALKRRTFAELEGLCNAEAIFASNTSSFMPSMLCVGLKHPERLLVTHYWNPAHLLPLVEVVPHEQTTPAVVQYVCALLKACGIGRGASRNRIRGELAVHGLRVKLAIRKATPRHAKQRWRKQAEAAACSMRTSP